MKTLIFFVTFFSPLIFGQTQVETELIDYNKSKEGLEKFFSEFKNYNNCIVKGSTGVHFGGMFLGGFHMHPLKEFKDPRHGEITFYKNFPSAVVVYDIDTNKYEKRKPTYFGTDSPGGEGHGSSIFVKELKKKFSGGFLIIPDRLKGIKFPFKKISSDISYASSRSIKKNHLPTLKYKGDKTHYHHSYNSDLGKIEINELCDWDLKLCNIEIKNQQGVLVAKKEVRKVIIDELEPQSDKTPFYDENEFWVNQVYDFNQDGKLDIFMTHSYEEDFPACFILYVSEGDKYKEYSFSW